MFVRSRWGGEAIADAEDTAKCGEFLIAEATFIAPISFGFYLSIEIFLLLWQTL